MIARLISALALLTGPIAAQAAPAPPAQPAAVAELLIGLAVAEARCTGSHQKMLARFRPMLQSRHAAAFRQAGQQMAMHYQQAHGDGWQAALTADLVAVRTRFEQQADDPGAGKRFCRKSAVEARSLSGAELAGASNFRGMNVEGDLYGLAAR